MSGCTRQIIDRCSFGGATTKEFVGRLDQFMDGGATADMQIGGIVVAGSHPDRPFIGHTEHLVGARQRAGMAEHHRRALQAHRIQGQARAERNMVDHDAVGLHLLDDCAQSVEHTVGIVHQVMSPGVGLVSKRCDWAGASGIEERSQVCILALGLQSLLDHTGVAALPQAQLRPMQSGLADHVAHRRAGGDHDLAMIALPGTPDLEEWAGVRGIVRADDQQLHRFARTAATSQ